MGAGGKAELVLDGKSYNVASRYMIPPNMAEKYCTAEIVEIRDREGAVEFTNGNHCRGCGRNYTDATVPTRLCCNSSSVNKHFGYVVPLCVDCYYYIQWDKGQPVNKHLRALYEKGFLPSRIYDYI